jgi:hypothetical protein
MRESIHPIESIENYRPEIGRIGNYKCRRIKRIFFYPFCQIIEYLHHFLANRGVRVFFPFWDELECPYQGGCSPSCTQINRG